MSFQHIIPSPDTGRFLLVVTPYVIGEAIFDLAARLSLGGTLEILDGGNTFNAYLAMDSLRRLAPIQTGALNTTRLARAFTCYQVISALEELEESRVTHPLLVLDLLNTFGDESVAVRERRRLLNRCLALLQRLARQRPVGVWVRKREVAPAETLEFLAQVERAAGRLWRTEPPPNSLPAQRSFFQ